MADPYFSELKYLGGRDLDFIEVAVDPDTDVSNLVITIYFSDGTIRSTNTLAGITPTRSGGQDIYVIDTTSSGTFTGLAKTNGISLSEGGTVYQFNSFSDPPSPGPVTAVTGPASGLQSTVIGQAGAGDSLISSDDGATYTVNTDPTPGTIPCLTAGTLVETDQGPVLVEDLGRGQKILTRDGSARPLLRIIRRDIKPIDLRRNPKFFPVRICAGALGQGLPSRDLLVSRQHRMLVSSVIVRRMFGCPEALIAAIRMTSLPGVFVDDTVTQVSYFHLIFASHEVIFANGAPTESLLFGSESLKALPKDAVDELTELFPELSAQVVWEPACMVPVGARQKKLVARHVQNRRPLLSDFAHDADMT